MQGVVAPVVDRIIGRSERDSLSGIPIGGGESECGAADVCVSSTYRELPKMLLTYEHKLQKLLITLDHN